MQNQFRISYVEKPAESAWGIIGQGINEFNDQKGGAQNSRTICFAVYDPDQKIVGGIVTQLYWDWLYIDLMWLREDLRKKGYGSCLLKAAEDEARKHGAKQAYLDTFSFQAPEFYKKHGYEEFGVLPEFPAGHKRFFFTKAL